MPNSPLTRLLRRIEPRLGLKLAGCLVAGGVLIVAGFGVQNYSLQRQSSEELVTTSAARIGDIILRSLRFNMLANDREAVYQMIRDIASEPGLRRIRIFSKEGVIRFSTDADEMGRVVDKQAEQCYACHSQAEPLTSLKRPDRFRILRADDGSRELAMIQPIENEPACANAACHAHPPSQKVLGVIDTHISLAGVDAQLARQRNLSGVFSLLAALLLSGVSIWFVWLFVHRPVHDLIAGTRRVAQGDLKARVTVRSGDELGQMAESFNHMAGELEEAHREVTDWANALKERADRKTRDLEKAEKFLAGNEKLASLGKLAAAVAHEVNNPLFGILTYARLGLKDIDKAAARGPDAELCGRLKSHLDIIARESQRCGNLMRNLLTFARQVPSVPAPNRLQEIVDRTVPLVRHQLELQKAAIQVKLPAGLPEVACDPSQIQQVLIILLVNAADAMTEGGSVTLEAEVAANAMAVRVRDTGPGIPETVLPKIFEPFFTTKSDQQRTGLGLSVARGIVDQHGGTLTARNHPEGGAEFEFRLPLAGAETEASPNEVTHV